MRINAKKDKKGQSLIELIIGIGVVAILVSSFVSAIVIAVRINQQSALSKTASDLSQELSDKARSVTEGSWTKLYSLSLKASTSTYYVVSGVDSVVTADPTSIVGTYASLELDSLGYPVVSYYEGGIPGNLKLLHCNDPNCTGGDEFIETIDTLGDVGDNTSLVLSAGNPVISYFHLDDGDMKLIHCDDPNCTGGETASVVDAGVTTGWFTSIELDSAGNPVVSYYTDEFDDLKIAHCNDPACVGGDESITVPDSASSVGKRTSLELDLSGNPVVSYVDEDLNYLKILHCDDVDCAGSKSIEIADTSVDWDQYTSLELDSSGNPVVSYHTTSGDLKILHCTDPDCSGAKSIQTPDSSTSTVGLYSSLELDISGNPVVSYYDSSKGDLKILHCNDPNCSGGDESIEILDGTTGDDVGLFSSLKLDSNWNPVIAYHDATNGTLKIFHCNDGNCSPSPGSSSALSFVSGQEQVLKGNATYTRWFSVENVNRDSNGDIVGTGGAEDTSTQKLTTTVQWPFRGDIQEITTVEYFTRSNKNRVTRFTDWGGNSGVEGPIVEETWHFSTSTGLNLSTPGQLKL